MFSIKTSKPSISVWVLLFTAASLLGTPLRKAEAQSSSKARGGELFAMVGCAHCHGVAGMSGGRGPSLAKIRDRKTPEQMYMQIHDGGKSMPPFGDQLTSDQIHDLVQYLLSKRRAPTQKP